MSEHPIDILLRAKDQASAQIKGVNRQLGVLDKTARGLKTVGKAGLVGLGIGAGLVAAGVKNGIESLATLETAVTSVDGAIAAMGYTSTLSGAQVAAWANEIETATGAAFDDKDITSATTNLIRYGNIAPDMLNQAMVVMTDLAAKTGDVETTSKAMAKALADPTKATRLLKDAGVVLTKEEQKRIKTLVESGKTHKAQALLLELVAAKTKGAALASQGPYERAMATMQDAAEDAQRALAEGFLPVIMRAADWIKGVLADPGTLNNIRNFGDSLANAFDEALTFAQKIPWKAIGDGIKTAADWAGKLFDAFRSLPPEMQATIIALAGLNKLSGGAISGIVGELGKGLIKGVLGMTAGVVNLNAAVVNGGGGLPDPTGGKGGKGKLGQVGNTIKKFAPLVPAVGTAVVMGDAMKNDPGYQKMQDKIKQLSGEVGKLRGSFRGDVRDLDQNQRGEQAKLRSVTTKGDGDLKVAEAKSLDAFRSGERTSQYGLANVAGKTTAGAMLNALTQNASASRIVAAVNASRAQTFVTVNVTAASVTKATTTVRRYGTSNGSRDINSGHGK